MSFAHGRASPDAAASRLTARARVAPPAVEPLPAGLHRLPSGWLCVPAGAAPERAGPLVVLLHGAGSSGRAMVELLGEIADAAGALLLAPDSAGTTWDAIRRGFGRDVARIDAALGAVHDRWRVDPCATVLAGFSDGASYALSLGLANGDRFSHLVAFSPGFVAPGTRRGRPPIYISHGRDDPVLPIDRCSRRIAPALRAAGYEVELVEFDGGHGVPPDIARAALRWVASARRCMPAPGASRPASGCAPQRP